MASVFKQLHFVQFEIPKTYPSKNMNGMLAAIPPFQGRVKAKTKNVKKSLTVEESPSLKKEFFNSTLTMAFIETPLGTLKAIADETALFQLQFEDKTLKDQNSSILPGWTAPLRSIERELRLYFQGNLVNFQTPMKLLGTPFQIQTWKALQRIPFGKTCSYSALASSINKPSACRAVAQANGANPLVIIIPCHRVINTNGKMGGYSAGLERKQWLLAHEKKN